MKIKKTCKPYKEVMALKRPEHKLPRRPGRIMSKICNLVGAKDLKDTAFTYEEVNMERAGDGPWLILMNHSSFIDLMIASKILYPRRYNIVCTSDGLVGKETLMRMIGCIPTQKFVTDISLISDMNHALNVNKTSILLYPEASYSFDGTATPLPRRMGVIFKKFKVPVVMITTYGAFTRDPLYNNLRKRNVHVSAKIECLLTPEEIAEKKTEEIDGILDKAFDFDYFKWQEENNVLVRETFRAEGLNRILYKCPDCMAEGKTEGSGISFRCNACGKEYEMDELGRMHALDGNTKFPHIPDWYRWEREEVKKEISEGTYLLESDVDIGMIVDFKSLYMVGSGHLKHTPEGFVLDGCDGELHYEQGPRTCYSLYSDYFWYEIGDIICIGGKDCLYYCFTKEKDIVAKARIATEEIYKLNSKK